MWSVYSIVDATAGRRDNNQFGVTSCDNFLPIHRPDGRPPSAVPSRPGRASVVQAARRVLMLKQFERCWSIMMMVVIECLFVCLAVVDERRSAKIDVSWFAI